MILKETDKKSSLAPDFTNSGLNNYIGKLSEYADLLYKSSVNVAKSENRFLVGENDVDRAYKSLHFPKRFRFNSNQLFLGSGASLLTFSADKFYDTISYPWIFAGFLGFCLILYSLFLKNN